MTRLCTLDTQWLVQGRVRNGVLELSSSESKEMQDEYLL